jgi:phenylpropionate dioxygenase-like ring-hydroxylating dioxygenase large terminal subunit
MLTKTVARPTGPIAELPPFPEGWYFIGSRASILRKKFIEKTWVGEEIVVWCDAENRIRVTDAICPHLGSHLGPSVGGKVRDGCLVCPFHGYEFDGDGQCVATPYAPAPKTARLRTYETTEILGMIFAWWGYEGRGPQWRLPDIPDDGTQWSDVGFRTLRFPGHVQTLAENSVDFGHLSYIHGYDNVTPVGELEIDGAYLRSSFTFKRVRKFAGFEMVHEVETTAHIHGLGYSSVEIHEKTIGFRARYWVLATPVDATRVELTLANSVREMRKPRRAIMGMRFLPVPLRHRAMNQFLLTQQKWDVQQDVVVWERMRYQQQPRLCRSDGPIGAYRRYCRQFYPELAMSKAS